ncbi:MAG: carbamoyl-phosphate synthase large subunit [Labilithrix sp.]|nr:carbamoyl-phosphate synthase large subunit [Labilithrix sp.]MCW5812098.1 carbamoyl-phosphate synthase large subunit [Labilithrix sp.]
MPKRTDLRRILVLGAGPIVIGQGCEFDYSGTQGVRALKAEGYEVLLVNSNPATIMTDPELADRTYVEPLDVRAVRAIVEKERPDAILPTLGGQTALNLALALDDEGTLSRLGVELLGARGASIRKAEDRALFKEAMTRIGLACPRAAVARSVDDARKIADELGYPLILRPSFTLGGSGGGIVKDATELEAKISYALRESPSHDVLVEESLLGWKEFELEVIRDKADNFIVVCTIENLDPLGVHTGDSITVAPAMTLTDKEYQRLRDAARAVMSEIGVETGGANVQFAVRPSDGEVRVIEMNPRVSRSSALASKATGYPIAKIATKLAIGYSLDELRNDLTGTSAAFEPTLDYVVVKWPRFAFEKFPDADAMLGTQMKSVGETMAIGRTFAEAVQKAARGLETGLAAITARDTELAPALELSARPSDRRLLHVFDALRLGATDAQIVEATSFDPWFIAQFRRILAGERDAKENGLGDATNIARLKRLGISDARLAELTGTTEPEVRRAREAAGVRPTFACVDTCAAEMPGTTPYLYATWESESDEAARPSAGKKRVIVLGAGPNRIGQGIEFDYCCVHGIAAARELGFEAIMINSNPETVSTDYDIADRLYFEPITLESVLAICEATKPDGVLVQLGGQTPLKLSKALAENGVTLLGTPADAIDRAEDRGRFDELLGKLGIQRPASATAKTRADVHAAATRLGWPVLVRPSYVLGGRAMKIVRSREELDEHYDKMLAPALAGASDGDAVILVDRFLDDAIEVDVDCVADGKRVVIGAVMEHLERAGVHSGDSATILPPFSLGADVVFEIERIVRAIALELGVVGLMNTQLAVKDKDVYVLEVNPRASRTVPFVSKATGVPLARIATKVMLGKTLDELGAFDAPLTRHSAAKECVFPFKKLRADTILGPEMRSTGEVMGLGDTAARAYSRALRAIGIHLKAPRAQEGNEPGKAYLSVSNVNTDRRAVVEIARRLRAVGYALTTDEATSAALAPSRIPSTTVSFADGEAMLRRGAFTFALVTAEGDAEIATTRPLRTAALAGGVPCFTTTALARAGCAALEEDDGTERVSSLQEWYALE